MTDHDSAYAGLVDADEHDQWAFGTGFDDPWPVLTPHWSTASTGQTWPPTASCLPTTH